MKSLVSCGGGSHSGAAGVRVFELGASRALPGQRHDGAGCSAMPNVLVHRLAVGESGATKGWASFLETLRLLLVDHDGKKMPLGPFGILAKVLGCSSFAVAVACSGVSLIKSLADMAWSMRTAEDDLEPKSTKSS